ncbi:hypothetical protein Pyrde_1906 [Pyrodictium delaneyi]|uniref:Uncharacterized protein n=1 Tax=Pyrodictium delaneyi TaxID=1273541 RepID=A0A0P0N580_9CREN|nr:hypothetical protein [Pyrodictium delaneyi]ALL01949.1 hypothetical protein Pyrde_1906 [Pyrodictium delaneyi]
MAKRRGRKRKRSNPRLRYKKRYVKHRRLEEEAEQVSRASAELGEYVVKWLDEALDALRRGARKKAQKLIRRILRRGQASMLGKRRGRRGRTVFTDHLVVNSRGRVKHYGIHGVKGWNPESPEEVQFKNKRGEDLEYEEIGEVAVKPARRKIKRTQRWKRAGGKDKSNKGRK